MSLETELKKLNENLEKVIELGLTALAGVLNPQGCCKAGGGEPQPDVEPAGKPEPEDTGSTTAAPVSSTAQDQTTSDSSEAATPPPPPAPDAGAKIPPPPPSAPNEADTKPAKKITKARREKLNASMVEVANNLGDSAAVVALMAEFGVTTPAEFTKAQADEFVIKLAKL